MFNDGDKVCDKQNNETFEYDNERDNFAVTSYPDRFEKVKENE